MISNVSFAGGLSYKSAHDKVVKPQDLRTGDIVYEKKGGNRLLITGNYPDDNQVRYLIIDPEADFRQTSHYNNFGPLQKEAQLHFEA